MMWEWGTMCYRPYINTRLRKCRGIDVWKGLRGLRGRSILIGTNKKGPRLTTGPF
jgi:hypothetical protein